MPVDAARLAHALQARERMDRGRREALAARAEFDSAVCDLHRAGASLREIAEALDLSHQRVHQIVGQQPSVWARLTRRPGPRRQTSACSFCGRSQAEVEKLVAGPGVYICDGCIRSVAPNVRAGAHVTCSFCGRQRRDAQSMAARGDVRICDSCLRLCLEVLAEAAPDA